MLNNGGIMQYAYRTHEVRDMADQPMRCSRKIIRDLLLVQWKRLTFKEIEATHYSKSKIALLIESKYGIHWRFTENYLSNIERTLPLAT